MNKTHHEKQVERNKLMFFRVKCYVFVAQIYMQKKISGQNFAKLLCFIIIVIKYAFQLKGSLKKQYTEISEKQGIVSVYVLFHCHCHKDVVF